MPRPVTAMRDVINERQRQIAKEGWTSEHDDDHPSGVLAIAGACYALQCLWPVRQAYRQVAYDRGVPKYWPFDPLWWKPKNTRRDLVRAAALIVAEIERIDRGKESL